MAGRELTITPTKRERRKSPGVNLTADCSGSSGSQPPPMLSPTSSVADTTFEPTIDMMVNDFDDEATLNEEEALADLEAHNPEDEIATLKEESEMPIEELLAKYGNMTNCDMAPSPSSYKRSSSSSGSRRRRAAKRHCPDVEATESPPTAGEPETNGTATDNTPDPKEDGIPSTSTLAEEVVDQDELPGILPPEVNKKPHRSHLMDLYPDESFTSSTPHTNNAIDDVESFTPLQTLLEQVEAGEDEEEDSDTDSDDTRKMIMVGHDYQADIPEGLSQYGDILPYENEDQLIWEPRQVTEREVEDYLLKIQETRSLTSTEDGAIAELPDAEETTSSLADPTASVGAPAAAPPPTGVAAATSDLDSVVKDNEQALHLLVQCGYDFKEALRRKRINVVPLSDTMSSWSEEECQKFEEGIKKFGKDFYQIRQHQVRTRTMRELVQFYYQWKKSERRDQSFALNDTIDHMDVFINEGGERAGNGGTGILTGNGCSSHTNSSSSSSNGHSNGNAHMEHQIDSKDTGTVPSSNTSTRKSTTKNYSIMTGSQAGGGVGSSSTGSGRKRGASFVLDEENEDDEHAMDNLS